MPHAKWASEHAVVFVEDYDTYIGRRLYQGVRCWLNNPFVRSKPAEPAE